MQYTKLHCVWESVYGLSREFSISNTVFLPRDKFLGFNLKDDK